MRFTLSFLAILAFMVITPPYVGSFLFHYAHQRPTDGVETWFVGFLAILGVAALIMVAGLFADMLTGDGGDVSNDQAAEVMRQTAVIQENTSRWGA